MCCLPLWFAYLILPVMFICDVVMRHFYFILFMASSYYVLIMLVSFYNCHNGFPLDLDDHKNKWSRHRSFLYGCDRSPGMHVLKLGTKIPNIKQNDWSTIKVWDFWVREFGYVWGRTSTLTTPVRKRYQLDTYCLLKSNGHAFIYLILINWDAQILLRISELFEQRSFSVINGLKVTLI